MKKTTMTMKQIESEVRRAKKEGRNILIVFDKANFQYAHINWIVVET